MTNLFQLGVLLGMLVLPALAAASEPEASAAGKTAPTAWPQWGGPNRDASGEAPGALRGSFDLREAWRSPIGKGLSALVIADGRLFTQENGADFGVDPDAVLAFDAMSGEELWRFELSPSSPAQHEFGIPMTPATDGRRVFVLDTECHFLALDAASGEVLWRHDLREKFGTPLRSLGCWTSPLLYGESVILQANGRPDRRVMAFDPATGEPQWGTAGVQWAIQSSPGLATLHGVNQVLIHDFLGRTSGIYALAPHDGEVLWSFRPPETEEVLGTLSGDLPFQLAENLVAFATWDQLVAVRVTQEGEAFAAESAWVTREVRAGGNPANIHAVAHGDHVYGFGGEYLHCLDAASGESLWREKIYPGSLIVVDDHLVVLSQAAGFLRIVEASPQGYREKWSREVLAPGAPADTPPSFAEGHVYLRNSDEILALELVSDPSSNAEASSPAEPSSR